MRRAARAAGANGRLDALHWIDAHCRAWKTPKVIVCTAAGGHLACLDYVLANGCLIPPRALEVAASGGHVEAMRRLYAACGLGDNGDDCTENSAVATAAAAAGHLDCLECAHVNGCAWDKSATKAAAAGGHLDCLVYAHENGCAWTKWTVYAAAAGGHVDCLAFACENGCNTTVYAADHALRGGRAACLAYLLGVCGSGVSTYTWKGAARLGSVECLDILSTYHPIPSRHGLGEMLHAAICHGHTGVLSWIMAKNETHAAARLGRLDCLRVVTAAGPREGDNSVAVAAAGGHLACIEYLCARGFPMDARACQAAAGGGHVDCLSFLHATLGCPWDERACAAAAAADSVKCLEYLRANGCPWSRKTVSAAIKHGQTRSLVYALENGCPCDMYAAAVLAVKCDRPSCLRALCRAGAPIDQRLLSRCISGGIVEHVRVLAKHDCPRGRITCAAAAKCEDVAMLRALYRTGFPWGQRHTIMGHDERSVADANARRAARARSKTEQRKKDAAKKSTERSTSAPGRPFAIRYGVY
ncbi:Ankyrin repeat domain containing protein [Pandoravirus salinus]|uniref:Ankyrin repeat domain containing protein n=1 Tax=Pandoravirus salinus TaxID=1349410 RepID=S4W361_9VIRU|nr:ankyrin repeat domain [Pandoravirus salinus]AGO85007.1 Ankyrin repeat domain containing protein [Pandoravirus salinus]